MLRFLSQTIFSDLLGVNLHVSVEKRDIILWRQLLCLSTNKAVLSKELSLRLLLGCLSIQFNFTVKVNTCCLVNSVFCKYLKLRKDTLDSWELICCFFFLCTRMLFRRAKYIYGCFYLRFVSCLDLVTIVKTFECKWMLQSTTVYN